MEENNETPQSNIQLLVFQKTDANDTTTPEQQKTVSSDNLSHKITDNDPPNEVPPPEEYSQNELVAKYTKTPNDRVLMMDSTRSNPVKGCVRLVSSLYAKLLIAVTGILLTTEVLPNTVPLFFFHGYLYIFLFGGAILCILCIYLSLASRACTRSEESDEMENSLQDCESATLRRKLFNFRSPEISVFFRVGAFVFGLGTLAAISLEISVLFTLEKPCVDKLNFILPILHAIFTLLQTHFLTLKSKKSIQCLGWCRHIILMHLMATNFCVWLRLIVWESTKSLLLENHININGSDRFSANTFNTTVHFLHSNGKHESYVSSNCVWMEQDQGIESLLRLHQCYQNSTIGIIWDKAQPFLTPFIIQYCFLGVVIYYILWKNRSQRDYFSTKAGSWSPNQEIDSIAISEQPRKVDCKGSSKGLFLGLLVLSVGIVVLILFFVLTNNQNLKEETLFIMITVHCSILGLSFLGILLGICRVNSMCTGPRHDQEHHNIFQNIGVFAVYVHGICSLVIGTTNFHQILSNVRQLVTFIDGALMIIQSFSQSILFHRIGQKSCFAHCQHKKTMPGRQIITFLAFANLVLWVTETFTNHNDVSNQLQLQFFGSISWGFLSRILSPLVMFYRFHSSTFLMEMWKSSYSV